MNWNEISDALQNLSPVQHLYIGAAVIVLVCLLILLLRRQPKQIVAYVTENGRVMVSRSAIVELVRTTCEQLQVVSKPHVKMRIKGKTSHFNIAIKLKNSGQLRQVEQALQAHLRQALTENLGIEHLGKINIIATGFKSGRLELSSPVSAPLLASTAKPSEPVVDEEQDSDESSEREKSL